MLCSFLIMVVNRVGVKRGVWRSERAGLRLMVTNGLRMVNLPTDEYVWPFPSTSVSFWLNLTLTVCSFTCCTISFTVFRNQPSITKPNKDKFHSLLLETRLMWRKTAAWMHFFSDLFSEKTVCRKLNVSGLVTKFWQNTATQKCVRLTSAVDWHQYFNF